MNETRREIALAATIVGGLVIGTVAAGQAAGGPAPITFLTDHQGNLGYAGLADGEVADPGLAWVALPACVNDEPGHSVEIRDVRLVNAQGVQVESVFVDATLREDDDAAGRLGSGAGAGWPAPDAEYSSWASGVTASCAEYRGGSLDRANRVHVVLSTTDLGASRIPAFDGVEVDWSTGRLAGRRAPPASRRPWSSAPRRSRRPPARSPLMRGRIAARHSTRPRPPGNRPSPPTTSRGTASRWTSATCPTSDRLPRGTEAHPNAPSAPQDSPRTGRSLARPCGSLGRRRAACTAHRWGGSRTGSRTPGAPCRRAAPCGRWC